MLTPTRGPITFAPVATERPGTIRSILDETYRGFLDTFPSLRSQEHAGYAELDDLAFSLPGSWIFLTRKGGEVIGFASFDPRQFPLAIIGHNCILPAFQGHGFGKLQMLELLRVLRERSFSKAIVSTGDHPFFVPAQHMYLSCALQRSGEMLKSLGPASPLGRLNMNCGWITIEAKRTANRRRCFKRYLALHRRQRIMCEEEAVEVRRSTIAGKGECSA